MIYSYADLKNVIKVGDTVKAVAGKYNPCTKLNNYGSNTAKITEIYEDGFRINGCRHYFIDSNFLDLIPREITWETLRTGDEVKDSNGVYTVLARIDDLVFLSKPDAPKESASFWTISEVQDRFIIIQHKQEEEVLMTVAEIAEKLNIPNLKIVK